MNYLENYGTLKLRSGAGGSFENGLCVMEAVAWLNGEEATDRPVCACPVLGAFAIKLNDSLNDENRQKLLPLAVSLAGTKSVKHEQQRAEYIVLEVSRRILSQMFVEISPEVAKMYKFAKNMDDVTLACLARKFTADYTDAAYTDAAYFDYAAHDCAYANYTNAAHNAAHTAAARQSTLLKCVAILEGAIAIGPNGNDQLEKWIPRVHDLGEFADTVLATEKV